MKYLQKVPRQMITGREIVFMVLERNKTDQTLLNIKQTQDFLHIELKGDNLIGYLTDIDNCLMYMENLPPEDLQ